METKTMIVDENIDGSYGQNGDRDGDDGCRNRYGDGGCRNRDGDCEQ